MRLRWPFSRRRAPAAADLRDETVREQLADRRFRRQLLAEAAQGNANALRAAALLSGAKGARMAAAAAPEPSLGDRLTEVLVERALQPPEDPLTRLYQMREVARQEREIRRELRDDDGDDDGGSDGTLGQLADVARAIAPVVAAVMGVPLAPPNAPPGAPAAPGPAALPAPAAPPPAPSPSPSPSAHTVEADPSMPSIPAHAFSPGQVLDHLEQDPPEVFAAWFLAQPHGPAAAAQLCALDDDALRSQLARAAAAPAWLVGPLHPVLVWLHQHEAHATQVVAALRAATVATAGAERRAAAGGL